MFLYTNNTRHILKNQEVRVHNLHTHEIPDVQRNINHGPFSQKVHNLVDTQRFLEKCEGVTMWQHEIPGS